MQSHRGNLKQVLWAYDPFERDLTIDRKTIIELAASLKQMGAAITPVHIFTPTSSGERFSLSSISGLIQEQFKQWPIEIERPVVLINPSRSVGKAIELFSDYANKVKADLILVTSHGRRGFERMAFGSFAETLLRTAKKPVLFLNHDSRVAHSSLQKVFWATDFSKECEAAFRHFISHAHGFCSEIIIYHEVNLALEMTAIGMYGAMGVPAPITADARAEQEKWAKGEAKKWIRRANKAGFVASAIVHEGYDLTRTISEEAIKNNIGLVVMAAHSTPLEVLLMGSHAKAVFRSGVLPVWVYGPRCFERTSNIKLRDRNNKATPARHAARA